MSTEHVTAKASHDTHAGLSAKGLKAGSVGLIGAVVIGVSCIAPAYTLTAALGPTVAEVGVQLPAIFLVGFIPMLLVALRLPRTEQRHARRRNLLHLGHRAPSAPGSAGWAAGD